MEEVTQETLRKAYKPYDIVTDQDGNVGFIQEVDVNDCQPDPECQISYAVKWLVSLEDKHAWFDHDELTCHGNLFIKIAECSCDSMGSNEDYVADLFVNFVPKEPTNE